MERRDRVMVLVCYHRTRSHGFRRCFIYVANDYEPPILEFSPRTRRRTTHVQDIIRRNRSLQTVTHKNPARNEESMVYGIIGQLLGRDLQPPSSLSNKAWTSRTAPFLSFRAWSHSPSAVIASKRSNDCKRSSPRRICS